MYLKADSPHLHRSKCVWAKHIKQMFGFPPESPALETGNLNRNPKIDLMGFGAEFPVAQR